MLSSVILAISALAGFSLAQDVGAQGQFQSPEQCCNVTVSTATANTWCMSEHNSCPEVCGGQTSANDCSINTMTWNCTCFKGNTPNISDYGQTFASLQCAEWVRQCVNAHPNDLDGQTMCHSVVCGAKNASAVEGSASTTSSSMSSASTSSGGSSGGSSSSASGSAASGSTSAAPSSSGAAVAMQMGKEYGTGIVGAVLFALFGLAL